MTFPEVSRIRVATAGEALIDLIEDASGHLRPCPGGAVYNLTRALALQGVGTLYLNPLSADRFGGLLADGLAQAGVRLARTLPVPQPTSLAVVGLDAQGKASYSFHREGVADRQIDAPGLNLACDAVPDLRVVATGCLALVPDDHHKLLPWLRTQRAAGRLVVVDANLRPALVPDMEAYRDNVMAALRQAHLIKVSDDDLMTLGLKHPDPLSSARALLADTRACWLALTLGPRGAVLLQRDGRAWHATETTPVMVVDTVGAGDCFLAGLLAALLPCPAVQQAIDTGEPSLHDEDARRVLAHAVASASLCVMEAGCTPPDSARVARRLRESPPSVNTL